MQSGCSTKRDVLLTSNEPLQRAVALPFCLFVFLSFVVQSFPQLFPSYFSSCPLFKAEIGQSSRRKLCFQRRRKYMLLGAYSGTRNDNQLRHSSTPYAVSYVHFVFNVVWTQRPRLPAICDGRVRRQGGRVECS